MPLPISLSVAMLSWGVELAGLFLLVAAVLEAETRNPAAPRQCYLANFKQSYLLELRP